MVGNLSSHVLSSAVEWYIFINTSMACSQTGGMTVGPEGVTMVELGVSGPGGGAGGGGQGFAGGRPLKQLWCLGTLGH